MSEVETIHERIKRLRKARGYASQAALAEAVGVTQQTVSEWESTVVPSTLNLKALANVLKTPFESLTDLVPTAEDAPVTTALRLGRVETAIVELGASITELTRKLEELQRRDSSD